MPAWKTDVDLFNLIKQELFTAVIGDVMDAAGLVHQFLPPEIKLLSDAMVAAGRAMPVLEADCFGETIVSQDKKSPFGLMFDALDNLRSGEVYVCQGGSPRYALWGELMSTRVSRVVAPNV